MIEPYLLHALIVGAIVSIVAGVIGTFIVMRAASFAAHALSQIGFAGAAGAVLLGLSPIFGLITFALGGAVAMSLVGAREHRSDAVTALVMTASLGIGALFLTLNATYATSAFALLFGSIVGISTAQVYATAALAALALAIVAIAYRPLIFATANEEAATASGIGATSLNGIFLIGVALAAAVTVPTVGALLVFALMIAPPAAAIMLARTPAAAVALAIAFNVMCCLGGIAIAYASSLPVGFCIAALATLTYLAARTIRAAESV